MGSPKVMRPGDVLRRELTDRERKAIIAEHGGDAEIAQIARHYTLTVKRVREVWREAGLPMRGVLGSVTPSKAPEPEARRCRRCGRVGEKVRYRLGTTARKGWVCCDMIACRAACGEEVARAS